MPSMKMRRSATMAMIALAIASSSVSGFNMAASSVEKQCKATTSCMRGGSNVGPMCTIALEDCPKCMTFNDGGCYEKVDGKCNFGKDCEPYWTQSEGSASAATDTPEPTTSSPSSASQGGNGDNAGNGTASSSGSTSSLAGETGAASSSKDGPDMVLVFGIVGGCILIIAVAAIFFVLVRRSRAGDDDEEEMTPTAQIVTKGQPSTTTNAVSYAPYAQRSGANPTTPTNRVIQYYNDNSLPSPHGGRGGGGFGSQQQGQPPVKTVRPAAAANAPTFFKPPTATPAPTAYSAQPAVTKQQNMYSQQAPYANANNNAPYGNANKNAPYASSTASYASTTSSTTSYATNNSNAPTYAPAPVFTPAPAPVYTAQPAAYAAPAEPLFTVHAADEQPPPMVRRESSPRPRRESYEF